MDMSYFSLSSKFLKEKGLKIAIVYLHEKGNFEIWLSARNREISKHYESILLGETFDGITVFHDTLNLDAILESTLVSSPDFDDQAILIDQIEAQAERFISRIIEVL